MSYQSLHRAVERMSVVPSELGVGTLERRVSVRLGLLDAVQLVNITSLVASRSYSNRGIIWINGVKVVIME